MNYSICIRTLGKAGEKYARLLESIRQLEHKPSEILIVIPYGYEPPTASINGEKRIFCEKGMLIQRFRGIEAAKNEYVLLLDDDVEFDPSLFNKLIEPILKKKADITFPIYTDLLPYSRTSRIIHTLTLNAIPAKNRDMYVKIIPSGGYSYFRITPGYKKVLYSQSAPGMCLCGKKSVFLSLKLMNELWVQKPAFHAKEDAVLTYKAFLMGYKLLGVPNINIKHLDAGKISKKDRIVSNFYSYPYNNILFWYRFIFKYRFSLPGRMLAILSIIYWIFSNIILCAVQCIRINEIKLFRNFVLGVNDSFKYIKSDFS